MTEFKVLDNGFLKLLDTFGDELTIVNAARVSFGVVKEELDQKDIRLIKYLYKHKHFSPFRHQHVMMIIKAPEFVMRQWYKHVVGIETTSDHPTKDHAWNEISGRYVAYSDFYMPPDFRAQSDDNKQASEGKIESQELADFIWSSTLESTRNAYTTLLRLGMAKEQARAILPLSQYTEVYWTASFQAVMNFIELRDEKTSQWEIQEYAKVVKELCLTSFPKITKLWLENT